MTRKIYTMLFYVAVPFILLRMLWRSRHMPAYAKRWKERFGFFEHPPLKKPIWIHAVSVGEVSAAEPLIRALQQQFPEKAFVITTMTPTGSDRVHALFSGHVFHCYAPYDLPIALNRFLSSIDPCLFITMETELWPNLFLACHDRAIPIMVANARLSERSMKGYQRFHSLSKAMMDHITLLAAQGKSDAKHFEKLGLSPEKIVITGSIKFDLNPPASLSEAANALKQLWGSHRPVWMVASTHEGEEKKILKILLKLREFFPTLLLILAPRHPDRFHRVFQLCKKRGFKTVKRSDRLLQASAIDIFLVDTLGELALFYSCADIAFVGGSLVPIGGHNLLEPASQGIPTVIGPHMHHFAEITELFKEHDAVLQVKNRQELANSLIDLFSHPEKRRTLGENGLHVIENNRGALERHVNLVKKILANK